MIDGESLPYGAIDLNYLLEVFKLKDWIIECIPFRPSSNVMGTKEEVVTRGRFKERVTLVSGNISFQKAL